MRQVHARIRGLTPRGRCHEDLRRLIADLNPVLRGWGQYFRTGNAAARFTQLDGFVVRRLQRVLHARYGSRLRTGRARQWTRSFFEELGLYRLRGTVQYPGMA